MGWSEALGSRGAGKIGGLISESVCFGTRPCAAVQVDI